MNSNDICKEVDFANNSDAEALFDEYFGKIAKDATIVQNKSKADSNDFDGGCIDVARIIDGEAVDDDVGAVDDAVEIIDDTSECR